MGRSKLTPETIATIARHISNGSYQTDAALAAGVHPDTLVHWLQDGADEESGPKRDLYDAVQKAKAQASTGMLERIQEMSEDSKGKDWRGLAWILERTQPAKYGQRITVTQEAKNRATSQILRILRGRLDPEIFRTVVETLHQACDDDGTDGDEESFGEGPRS